MGSSLEPPSLSSLKYEQAVDSAQAGGDDVVALVTWKYIRSQLTVCM